MDLHLFSEIKTNLLHSLVFAFCFGSYKSGRGKDREGVDHPWPLVANSAAVRPLFLCTPEPPERVIQVLDIPLWGPNIKKKEAKMQGKLH